MSRRRRILLRLAVVLLVLVAIGLAAFTWFAYWPLEGDVDDLKSLVPGDVDFVYRGSWSGLRDTGWLQENLFEHPLLPAVADAVPDLRLGLAGVVDGEAQINDQIPGDIVKFSFEDDVFPGETIFAGRFCEDWDPKRGAPRWWEALALTRVSWKVKFVSALKHEFVRKMLLPDFTVTDEGDGIYKIVISPAIVRPTPVQARTGCAAGVVIPPENIWYVRRIRDVLALGSSRGILEDVGYLDEYPDSGRSYLDRPWVTLDAPSNAVAVSIDLHPLEHYLVRFLEIQGPPATILQRYLTLTALDRMNGSLVLPSRDMALVKAGIRYQPSQLAKGIQEVYALTPEEMDASVAASLPAKDTFAALLLRTPPLHLIQGIYLDILGPGDRRLWNENLRRMGKFNSIDEFFEEFAENLSDTAGIAVGRMSDTFDEIDHTGFFGDVDVPDPHWPALAMMVRLRSGVKENELDAYLAERVPLLGAKSDLEKVEYRGQTYTRIQQEMKIADYATMKPAYMLAQDHFIFASNEEYFRKIIDTMVDPRSSPPLSADPTFLSTMRQLRGGDGGAGSHLTFFVDLEKLFRVPPHRGSGAQPRGFLWDQRQLWVRSNRHFRHEAIRYREELKKEHTRRTQRALTAEEADEIERRVMERADVWKEKYPEHEEEYREILGGYERVRAFGAGIRAERPTLQVRFAVLLRRPEAAAAGTSER